MTTMVAIIIIVAVLAYAACIVILCHNAMPYKDEWDEWKG